MKQIPIKGGYFALVDDEDFEVLSRFSWHLGTDGYAVANVSMHRLVHNPPKGKWVDHKDGHRLNNTRGNLRLCTSKENSKNLHKSKNRKYSSVYIGVCWKQAQQKWLAQVKVNKRSTHIGYFDNEHHAALARDLWARDLNGEFANLNFDVAV